MGKTEKLLKRRIYEKQSEAVLASLRELAKSFQTYDSVSLMEVRKICSKVPISVTETIRELRKTD